MNFTSYILTVSAIALLTSVSHMILPQGRLKNTASIIFNLLVITALISPLINIDYSFDFSFEREELAIDQNAVNNILMSKADILEEQCACILEDNQIAVKSVDIVCDFGENNLYFKKVNVILDQSRISDNGEHINITSKAINLLCDFLSIGKEVLNIEYV